MLLDLYEDQITGLHAKLELFSFVLLLIKKTLSVCEMKNDSHISRHSITYVSSLPSSYFCPSRGA